MQKNEINLDALATMIDEDCPCCVSLYQDMLAEREQQRQSTFVAFADRATSFSTTPDEAAYPVPSTDEEYLSNYPVMLATRTGRVVELHTCDDHCRKFVAEIAAPGYGYAYRCTVTDRPWLKIGTSFVDPTQCDPTDFELSPADVI